MAIATTTLIVALVIILAVGVGAIVLQIYLSKKENKWFGLILPIISFCISLIAVFGIAAYTTTTLDAQVIDENGVVIQNVEPEASVSTQQIQDTPSLIFSVGSVFLLYNIPTIVLLAIYFACREKIKRKKALDKMNIQDLE